MSEDVLLVEREGPVTVLTLNRPRARNALDRALVQALGRGLAAAAEDPGARAVVLTGAGSAFCSGADLKAAMAEGTLDQLDGTIDAYHAMIRAIIGAPKPVIAAVDGGAVGFGCDLALALRPARPLDGGLPSGDLREHRPHARRRRHASGSRASSASAARSS